MKSVIQTGRADFISGSVQKPVHKHHCLTGGLRDFAERNGLFIYLAWDTHRYLHDHPEFEIQMKRVAQYVYEKTHTREEWMINVRKNYLTSPLSQEEINKFNLECKEYDIDNDDITKLLEA